MIWNAYILAGGGSTRMGRDKSMLEIDGIPLVSRAIQFLRPFAADVSMVGNHQHLRQFGRVVEDQFQDCGPLGGIHAALKDSRTEWNLIYAVDQLWRDHAILAVLAERAESAPQECLIVAPQHGHRPEPLCAFYRKQAEHMVAVALERHDYKIGRLFPKCNALLISEAEARAAGANTDMLNLNTPLDYAAALQSWEPAKL